VSSSRTFYKALRIDGISFEAQDLSRQRTYSNSVVRLKDGKHAFINKIFKEETGWRMFATAIEDGELGGLESFSVNTISDICIFLQVESKYYPMPLLQPLRLILP
jgi:hypothetical protein